jgi:hypothetical protein
VFQWCEASLRQPTGSAFELFARIAGRCSDQQKATPEYQVWFNPHPQPFHWGACGLGFEERWRLSFVQ